MSGVHSHPKHCFCQVPESELSYWAIKRFQEDHRTVDLMNSTDDPHQKELISIVGLIDVDEASMLSMMGNVDMPDHHLIHCRQKVKALLGLD
ncbi:hypothetical protein PQO03_18865 [Lentisphaera profundi]|uniref:Uncharacterized protein n=1 Tax=Lentisphaera profundi TaxID=1658616 RepID=A0ABY7VVG3_9BACT|nr:hypothetical protein [Lentisphaera profundi]WDE97891.1 hypothetical protein PQO03_18865 [Lentisphaera profundi]